MEVKSVFMDLQEGVKKGNVWKLESEAFKQPIEIKIGYENTELEKFNSTIEELREEDRIIKQDVDHCIHSGEVNAKLIGELQEKDKLQDGAIAKLNKKIEEQNGTINQLYKAIADLKTDNEVMRGLILHLQEKNNEIEKKITKQPIVYHDKIFISGNEEVMLGVYGIPDGDYLQILSIKIGEHNEYCENKDEVIIAKVHSQDGFTPRYSLYGGTELDTSTAMVFYDLVLIPL